MHTLHERAAPAATEAAHARQSSRPGKAQSDARRRRGTRSGDGVNLFCRCLLVLAACVAPFAAIIFIEHALGYLPVAAGAFIAYGAAIGLGAWLVLRS